MANPLRLAYRNWADQALISGLVSVSSLPLANLKTDDIQEIWRSAETGAAQALVIDLSQQRQIGAVGLVNSNAVSPVTVHVRVSTSDPTGVDGNAYQALSLPGITEPAYNKFVHFIDPNVTGRYVRISLNNLTTSPEAGRLVVASTWAPSRDMSFGWEKLSRDASTVTESLGGNPFVDIKQRRRGWRFRMFPLTESEAEQQVDELHRLRGTGRDILVCRDRNSTTLGRDTLWGLLEAPVQQRRVEGGYELEMTVWDRV